MSEDEKMDGSESGSESSKQSENSSSGSDESDNNSEENDSGKKRDHSKKKNSSKKNNKRDENASQSDSSESSEEDEDDENMISSKNSRIQPRNADVPAQSSDQEDDKNDESRQDTDRNRRDNKNRDNKRNRRDNNRDDNRRDRDDKRAGGRGVDRNRRDDRRGGTDRNDDRRNNTRGNDRRGDRSDRNNTRGRGGKDDRRGGKDDRDNSRHRGNKTQRGSKNVAEASGKNKKDGKRTREDSENDQRPKKRAKESNKRKSSRQDSESEEDKPSRQKKGGANNDKKNKRSKKEIKRRASSSASSGESSKEESAKRKEPTNSDSDSSSKSSETEKKKFESEKKKSESPKTRPESPKNKPERGRRGDKKVRPPAISQPASSPGSQLVDRHARAFVHPVLERERLAKVEAQRRKEFEERKSGKSGTTTDNEKEEELKNSLFALLEARGKEELKKQQSGNSFGAPQDVKREEQSNGVANGKDDKKGKSRHASGGDRKQRKKTEQTESEQSDSDRDTNKKKRGKSDDGKDRPRKLSSHFRNDKVSPSQSKSRDENNYTAYKGNRRNKRDDTADDDNKDRRDRGKSDAGDRKRRNRSDDRRDKKKSDQKRSNSRKNDKSPKNEPPKSKDENPFGSQVNGGRVPESKGKDDSRGKADTKRGDNLRGSGHRGASDRRNGGRRRDSRRGGGARRGADTRSDYGRGGRRNTGNRLDSRRRGDKGRGKRGGKGRSGGRDDRRDDRRDYGRGTDRFNNRRGDSRRNKRSRSRGKDRSPRLDDQNFDLPVVRDFVVEPSSEEPEKPTSNDGKEPEIEPSKQSSKLSSAVISDIASSQSKPAKSGFSMSFVTQKPGFSAAVEAHTQKSSAKQTISKESNSQNVAGIQNALLDFKSGKTVGSVADLRSTLQEATASAGMSVGPKALGGWVPPQPPSAAEVKKESSFGPSNFGIPTPATNAINGNSNATNGVQNPLGGLPGLPALPQQPTGTAAGAGTNLPGASGMASTPAATQAQITAHALQQNNLAQQQNALAQQQTLAQQASLAQQQNALRGMQGMHSMVFGALMDSSGVMRDANSMVIPQSTTMLTPSGIMPFMAQQGCLIQGRQVAPQSVMDMNFHSAIVDNATSEEQWKEFDKLPMTYPVWFVDSEAKLMPIDAPGDFEAMKRVFREKMNYEARDKNRGAFEWMQNQERDMMEVGICCCPPPDQEKGKIGKGKPNYSAYGHSVFSQAGANIDALIAALEDALFGENVTDTRAKNVTWSKARIQMNFNKTNIDDAGMVKLVDFLLKHKMQVTVFRFTECRLTKTDALIRYMKEAESFLDEEDECRFACEFHLMKNFLSSEAIMQLCKYLLEIHGNPPKRDDQRQRKGAAATQWNTGGKGSKGNEAVACPVWLRIQQNDGTRTKAAKDDLLEQLEELRKDDEMCICYGLKDGSCTQTSCGYMSSDRCPKLHVNGLFEGCGGSKDKSEKGVKAYRGDSKGKMMKQGKGGYYPGLPMLSMQSPMPGMQPMQGYWGAMGMANGCQPVNGEHSVDGVGGVDANCLAKADGNVSDATRATGAVGNSKSTIESPELAKNGACYRFSLPEWTKPRKYEEIETSADENWFYLPPIEFQGPQTRKAHILINETYVAEEAEEENLPTTDATVDEEDEEKDANILSTAGQNTVIDTNVTAAGVPQNARPAVMAAPTMTNIAAPMPAMMQKSVPAMPMSIPNAMPSMPNAMSTMQNASSPAMAPTVQVMASAIPTPASEAAKTEGFHMAEQNVAAPIVQDDLAASMVQNGPAAMEMKVSAPTEGLVNVPVAVLDAAPVMPMEVDAVNAAPVNAAPTTTMPVSTAPADAAPVNSMPVNTIPAPMVAEPAAVVQKEMTFSVPPANVVAPAVAPVQEDVEMKEINEEDL